MNKIKRKLDMTNQDLEFSEDEQVDRGNGNTDQNQEKLVYLKNFCRREEEVILGYS